jgi:hypothetical protein
VDVSAAPLPVKNTFDEFVDIMTLDPLPYDDR